ncbi:glycosyltransferase family 4 protein [Sulfitobacter sp. D35]|uniref:glycosyltransferase family 4 protein n=1 Tax=Sulfitobacter sp. D35 TaxID=3083252 RepID=UPI00296E75F0|nr:glycosyltransferase family 4 protein [Sulfitobacter sp. D35]MDW4496924.1 glycosyltransferase family 4 protein [Sulfitobacter sp. D35]
MSTVDPARVEVIAPNFKRRLSGVTATIVRLVPLQAGEIAIAATGPELPDHVPQIALSALPALSRRGPGPSGWRVWHARRNVEMIGGLVLRDLLRKRLKLVFTSASQREQSWLTRWLIRRMDAVVATSERTAAYLEGPSQVIMHGIDTEAFAPSGDRGALRRGLDLPDDGQLIGCYGRIRESKGTDVFAEAMIGLLADRPNAVALIMGRAVKAHEGFERDLRTRVADAGMENRIRFLPEVATHEIADWYRVLDLYVAPQRWEGFGLTPLEAMACGVPVVATRVGAFEALVAEGETGALVPPDNPEAIRDACAAILDEPERLAVMSEAARRRVEHQFSIEKEAATLVSLYRRLLSN